MSKIISCWQQFYVQVLRKITTMVKLFTFRFIFCTEIRRNLIFRLSSLTSILRKKIMNHMKTVKFSIQHRKCNYDYLFENLIERWLLIFYAPSFIHSNSETMIHFLKGIIGTGILAMPIAFSRSGYIVGFVGTIIIGSIYTHCIHMLLRSHYELCKRKKVIAMISKCDLCRVDWMFFGGENRCPA